MAQIINDNPGIGSLLGTGLGQGLSSGLQQLAQLKTNQLLTRHQQRQTAQGLSSLGFSPQESQQIAMLPQELQGLVIKSYLAAAQNSGLDQALQGIQVNPESESDITGLLQGSKQQLPANQGLASLLGSQQPGILNKQLPSEKVVSDLINKQQPVASSQKRETPAKQPEKAKEAPRNRLAELLLSPRLSPEQKLKVAALKQQKDIAQQKISAKEQEEVNKETKPVYDQIQKEYKASRDTIKRLDLMEGLIKTGKLDSPGFVSNLKTLGHGIFGMGIDLSHALSPESQEFEKLSNDFIKNAKDYFGTRLTDADLKAFLKTIPTLSLTDEGKLRVMRNLREFADAAILKKQASDKVLKENAGRRPRDYEQQVESLVEPDLQKLAQKFKENSQKDESRSLADKIADLIEGYRR